MKRIVYIDKNKIGVLAWLTIVFSSISFASSPAQVMPISVFHFANPGLDKVKTEVLDVTDEESQTYLIGLSKEIAKDYKPTKVLLECRKEQQASLNESYRNYLANKHQLSINENQQLGFRIAKQSGLKHIICYDEQEVHWQSSSVFEEMSKRAPAIAQKVNKQIEEMSLESNRLHQTESLKTILRFNNTVDTERKNKALYLLLNEVGAFGSYSGADSTASWWHRNFRMYANLQQQAKAGQRIVLIGGAGHTAIIKDLLQIDSERILVNPLDYL